MEETSNMMDFENEMESMFSVIKQMNSDDKTKAFSLLKKCVSNIQNLAEKNSSGVECNSDDQQKSLANCEDSVFNGETVIETSNSKDNSEEETELFVNSEERGENRPIIRNKSESDVEDFQHNDDFNFICPNCSQKFSSVITATSHLEMYPKNPMSCRQCTKEFNNEFLFNFHQTRNICKKRTKPMKESLSRTCSYCQKIFYNAQHFNRHVNGHKRNNCSLCAALFTNRKHLESHMLEVHDTKLEKNYFECKFCLIKLTQKRSMLKHYKLHHSKQCSVCTICGKFFDSANELDVHLLEHESKKWTCEPCKQTFIRHQQYVKHLNSHNKYFCITCDEGFPSRKKISSHCKLGHFVRGLETVHKCDTCYKVFDSGGKLMKHLRTHNGKDHFFCKTCDKSFNKASYYKQHLSSSIHKDKLTSSVVDSVHTCKLCSKSFPNKSKLLIHSQEIHGISHNIRRCPFCNYKTKQKANLKRHIDQHTQHRKYICEQCGSSFYTFSCLKEHIACIHLSERNFSCEKCGMSFKLNSGLRRHMAAHSDERTKKCHCGQAYKLSTNLKRHQLLVHGKVDSPGSFQRLSKNEFGEYVPVQKKTKVKATTDAEKMFALQQEEPKAAASIPDNSIALPDIHLIQPVQVVYQNLDFPPTNDNKQQLLYTPSIDIAHLHLVETMLQAAAVNESLKQPQDILVDPSGHSLFDRQIAETESYLAGDVTLNPPIEISQMTNLTDLTHSSQLPADTPVSSHSDSQQNLINSLSDYIIPHQFPFLNV